MTEEKTEDQKNQNEEATAAKSDESSPEKQQETAKESKPETTEKATADSQKKETSTESKKAAKKADKKSSGKSGKKKSILDGPIEIKYKSIIVTCACGAEFESGSTLDKIHVDICSFCHPYFTGESKILDTEGRVDKFRKKYSNYSKK